MSEIKKPAVASGQASVSGQDIITSSHPPTKILVRVFADGFCEVYSDQHVQVYVQKVMDAPSPEGERLAIEFADLTLPLSHRGLDDCVKLVQTFDCRPISVADFVTAKASVGALHIFDSYIARVQS